MPDGCDGHLHVAAMWGGRRGGVPNLAIEEQRLVQCGVIVDQDGDTTDRA